MQTSEHITNASRTPEIIQLFGFIPPFFGPAEETPEVLENLQQQTITAYAHNPLPDLFKEKLFAYLSRHCSIPYCIICHSCALRSLGMTTQEILALLEIPTPTKFTIEEKLVTLMQEPDPLKDWPTAGSAIEMALLSCSFFLFLKPKLAERCRSELHRLLGPVYYNHLVGFLAYIKTYHLWVETHPELSYEADKRAQDYLGILLAEEPALIGFFATYNERVKQERQEHDERAEAHASELALREANRRMDEFLGIASHELKTPLTSIKGYVQLMARRLKNSNQRKANAVNTVNSLNTDEQTQLLEGMQDLLERTDSQIGRLNRLVNELLDISRVQANKLDLLLEPCDLTAIVSEIIQDQRQATPTRTIFLNIPSGQAVPLLADADRIRQVVSNYLTNALKYSEEDRPIEVSLEVEEHVARVSMRDEGTGLSPTQQEHIWERFYQAEGVEMQSGFGMGLGLGLYICRKIIELHSGQVGVRSTPGQGSIFWFTLPMM